MLTSMSCLCYLESGDEKVYSSSNSIFKLDDDLAFDHSEFIKDLKYSNILGHRLTLKKGVLAMLMRNLDTSIGLCNGTRLIINELRVNIIGAITGSNIDCKVYISRMNLVSFSFMVLFKFQRCQFHFLVCFVMKINKSQ